MFTLLCFCFIIQATAFDLTEIRCNVRQEAPNLSRNELVISNAVQEQDFPYAVQEENCGKQKECVGIEKFGDSRNYIYTNTTNSTEFGFRFIWKVSFSNASTYCNFTLHTSTTKGNLCLPQTKRINSTALYYDCIAPGPFGLGKGTGIRALGLQPKNDKIPYLITPIASRINCEYKIVQKSQFCHRVKIKITKPINCLNRSFEIHYNISNLNQSVKFIIRLNNNKYVVFQNTTERNMNPSGKIEYTLSNTSLYNVTYEILVFASYEYPFDYNSRYPYRENITDMFQTCLRSEPVRLEPYVYALIGVGLCCLLVIVVIVVFCLRRAGIACCIPLKSTEPTPPSVYIVFVDDHPKHRDTVLKFAAFLKFTLGFQVLFELYNNTEIVADPVTWMKQSIARAQKILFIWSPGATKRWENRSAGPGQNDMFTPVLVQVLSEISAGKNKNKHSIVCFDYVSCDDIPKELEKNFLNVYKLMEDLRKFCLQLIEHKAINPQKLSKHEYTTILSKSVKEMKEYVDEHPMWYKNAGPNQDNINNNENIVEVV